MGNWVSVLLGDSQNRIERTLNLSYWTGGRAGELYTILISYFCGELLPRTHEPCEVQESPRA